MEINRMPQSIIFLFILSQHQIFSDYFPFRNISLSWEERVDDLVGRLTLQEMVSQMAYGGGNAGPTPGIGRLSIEPYNFDTECLRGVNAPNKATAFPVSIAIAATFSYEVVHRMAEIVGTEARGIYHDSSRRGIYDQQMSTSCLAPFINIMRHPLWGRVQEIYGEDPFLSGWLAGGYVRGLQGDHPRYVRANAGCKTLAAHSGPDNIPSSRFSFNAQVSERDLRLSFLPQWKECIRAGSLNLMCSYNKLNGVPTCGDRGLIEGIARKEMGFKGYVISDWEAIRFIYTKHNYTSSLLEAVALAANSGVDLELPDTNPAYKLLYEAVLADMVSYKTIVTSNKRLFLTRMRLGHFDPPHLNPYSSINFSVIQSPCHREAAIVIATKSFVLLKNAAVLPIRPGIYNHIAMIGPMADNLDQLFGTYSPSIDERFSQTPYGGLRDMAPIVDLTPGCADNACQRYNSSAVINATINADFVIVCLGTGQQMESEGNDRSNLSLPGLQALLLADVINHAKRPILLLVFTAGPVDLRGVDGDGRVAAIIQCFLPAQATGQALKRLLFVGGINEGGGGGVECGGAEDSVVSPAGRLPYTWPSSLEQIPAMENYSMHARTYRYFKGNPLYPFGYGLSYTSFSYDNLQINPRYIVRALIPPGININISVTVRVLNQGPYSADEVVQVYIRWMDIPEEMPLIQLVGVARVSIKYNGTSQHSRVQLNISSEQLCIFNEEKGFYLHPGRINVYVGGQQPEQEKKVPSNVLRGSILVI